jgi:hypothetical protein
LTISTRRFDSTPASISSSSPSGTGCRRRILKDRIGAQRDGHFKTLAEPLRHAMMLRTALVPLPVHARRPAVVHLHAVRADVAHARFRIARDDERQRDERAAVFGPGGQHRQLVQAAVGLHEFLARRVLHDLRHQVGEPAHERHHLQRVHETAWHGRRRELFDLGRQLVEVLHTERQADSGHRAVDVRGDRHRVVAGFLEQQAWPAARRLGDTIHERGDLQMRIDRLADARQLARVCRDRQ